jgi:Flp pilus assembly protein TadG
VNPAAVHERGSAPAEFVLVTMLLLALTFGVLQVGVVFYVRNTALDAAAEGARWAAFAGNTPADGVARARQVLTASLGSEYAGDISASESGQQGAGISTVTVVTPLPVIGTFGPPEGLRVDAHAVLEPVP